MSTDEPRDDRTETLAALTAGSKVAHYEIIKSLGVGGMGQIFLARDSQLDRLVALKFLSAQLSTNSEFRERFFREARATARLNDPNIVTIHGVAEYENRIYIAMEYVEGMTLRELMDSQKQKVEDSLDIIRQICSGLAAAHTAGLVHRDIKPANIIIDKSGRVRILDFGLVKNIEDQDLTKPGTVMGTVNYMSPEQSKGLETDFRSDIFSMGIVAHELLAGQPPFYKPNAPATMMAITNDPHPKLAVHLSSALPGLQPLIDRALAKRPAERFTSMDQIVTEIDQMLGRTNTGISVASISTTPVETASLAVLYLRNLGSPDDDFLAYGLTEDLIIDLTRIGKVRVVPMRNVLKFKNSDDDLSEIAKQLDVTLVLDGSVHRSETTIRLSAQLHDLTTNASLWSDRWEQPLDSLPLIKKKLAEGLAGVLEFGQTIIHKAGLAHSNIENAAAYEDYLRGKFTFDHKQDQSDVAVAHDLFQNAIIREPSLLPARIGLAEVHIYVGEFDNAALELQAALEVANKDNLRAERGDILQLMARLHARRSNWAEATTRGIEALDLKRELEDIAGEAVVLGVLINVAQAQGDFDRAIVYFDRVLDIARQLDDRNRLAEAFKNMGVAFSRKGEFDHARDLYDQSLSLAVDCDNLSLQAACWSNIGNLEFFKGNLDQAYEHYDHAYEIEARLGDKAGMARHIMNKGVIEFRRLNFREGVKLIDEGALILKDLGDRSRYAMALINKSQAWLTLGQDQKAVEAAKEALKIADEIEHPLTKSQALLKLAAVEHFRKQFDKAKEYLEQAQLISDQFGISRNSAFGEIAKAELFIETNQISEAKHCVTRALTTAKEMGEKALILKSSLLKALITVDEGLVNMGLDQLKRLLVDIKKFDDTELRLYAEIVTGRTLIKYGNNDSEKDEGRQMIEIALATAKRHELVPLIRLAEEIEN